MVTLTNVKALEVFMQKFSHLKGLSVCSLHNSIKEDVCGPTYVLRVDEEITIIVPS